MAKKLTYEVIDALTDPYKLAGDTLLNTMNAIVGVDRDLRKCADILRGKDHERMHSEQAAYNRNIANILESLALQIRVSRTMAESNIYALKKAHREELAEMYPWGVPDDQF